MVALGGCIRWYKSVKVNVVPTFFFSLGHGCLERNLSFPPGHCRNLVIYRRLRLHAFILCYSEMFEVESPLVLQGVGGPLARVGSLFLWSSN